MWVVTIHQQFETQEEATSWVDGHELRDVAVIQEHTPYAPEPDETAIPEDGSDG